MTRFGENRGVIKQSPNGWQGRQRLGGGTQHAECREILAHNQNAAVLPILTCRFRLLQGSKNAQSSKSIDLSEFS